MKAGLSLVNTESFVTPTPRTELDGQLGLTVHEVARSLGTQHREVKEAVEREWDNIAELQARAITLLNETNGLPFQSYVLSVPAAQFIVARFGNKIGAAYCKYLISRDNERLSAAHRPVSPMDALIQTLSVLQAQQASIEALQANQADSNLTSSQVTEIDRRISAKVRELGGDFKTSGLIKRALKARFFKGPVGTRTYKEIASKDYQEVLNFISTYN
jgi:hypothetical protein